LPFLLFLFADEIFNAKLSKNLSLRMLITHHSLNASGIDLFDYYPTVRKRSFIRIVKSKGIILSISEM